MVSHEVEGSRGILTERDREFLNDPRVREELSSSARSQRWRNIRDRIRNSMEDFISLVRELPDEQRRRVFDDERLKDPDDPEWQENVFAYLVAFAHQQLGNEARLERVVKTGIRRAELTDGVCPEVDVSITVNRHYTTQDIRERFAQGGLDEVTVGELYALWHAGELSDDELSALLLERAAPSEETDFIDDMQTRLNPE